MRAYLLRHGESAHNANIAAEPLADELGDRLTPNGVEQARAAAAGLTGLGVTRLLTSPMRRATETADAVGAAIGLEAEELPYVHELGLESFEQGVARVRRLKAELEGAPAGERPLIVTHGIFIRFFLLDSMLGDEFAPRMAGRIWHLHSHNCGLSTFEPGPARDPAGGKTPGWACFGWMERPWARS
ncbi:MAG TPA: histidine phosphatase family protein [Solirubrobacterales bacterium]